MGIFTNATKMRHGKRDRRRKISDKRKSDQHDYRGFDNLKKDDLNEYIKRVAEYQYGMGNMAFPGPTSVSAGSRGCKTEETLLMANLFSQGALCMIDWTTMLLDCFGKPHESDFGGSRKYMAGYLKKHPGPKHIQLKAFKYFNWFGFYGKNHPNIPKILWKNTLSIGVSLFVKEFKGVYFTKRNWVQELKKKMTRIISRSATGQRAYWAVTSEGTDNRLQYSSGSVLPWEEKTYQNTALENATKKVITTGVMGTFILTGTNLYCIKNRDIPPETELTPHVANNPLTGISDIASGNKNVHFLQASSKNIFRLKFDSSRASTLKADPECEQVDLLDNGTVLQISHFTIDRGADMLYAVVTTETTATDGSTNWKHKLYRFKIDLWNTTYAIVKFGSQNYVVGPNLALQNIKAGCNGFYAVFENKLYVLKDQAFAPVAIKTEYYGYKESDYSIENIGDRQVTDLAVGNNELWIVLDNKRIFGYIKNIPDKKDKTLLTDDIEVADLTYKFLNKFAPDYDLKTEDITVNNIAMLETHCDPNMATNKLKVKITKTPHIAWEDTWREKYYYAILKALLPKYIVYSVTTYVKGKFTNSFRNDGHKTDSEDKYSLFGEECDDLCVMAAVENFTKGNFEHLAEQSLVVKNSKQLSNFFYPTYKERFGTRLLNTMANVVHVGTLLKSLLGCKLSPTLRNSDNIPLDDYLNSIIDVKPVIDTKDVMFKSKMDTVFNCPYYEVNEALPHRTMLGIKSYQDYKYPCLTKKEEKEEVEVPQPSPDDKPSTQRKGASKALEFRNGPHGPVKTCWQSFNIAWLKSWVEYWLYHPWNPFRALCQASEFTNITNKFSLYKWKVKNNPAYGKVIPNNVAPQQYNELDNMSKIEQHATLRADTAQTYNRVYVTDGDKIVPRCPGRLHNCLPIRHFAMDNMITSLLRRLPGAFLISKLQAQSSKNSQEKYHRPSVEDSADNKIVADAVLLTVILHLVKLFWIRWMSRPSFIELPMLVKKTNVITLHAVPVAQPRVVLNLDPNSIPPPPPPGDDDIDDQTLEDLQLFHIQQELEAQQDPMQMQDANQRRLLELQAKLIQDTGPGGGGGIPQPPSSMIPAPPVHDEDYMRGLQDKRRILELELQHVNSVNSIPEEQLNGVDGVVDRDHIFAQIGNHMRKGFRNGQINKRIRAVDDEEDQELDNEIERLEAELAADQSEIPSSPPSPPSQPSMTIEDQERLQERELENEIQELEQLQDREQDREQAVEQIFINQHSNAVSVDQPSVTQPSVTQPSVLLQHKDGSHPFRATYYEELKHPAHEYSIVHL